MALIACTECGGKVSTRAASCPHCGAEVEAQCVGKTPLPAVVKLSEPPPLPSHEPENTASTDTVSPTVNLPSPWWEPFATAAKITFFVCLIGARSWRAMNRHHELGSDLVGFLALVWIVAVLISLYRLVRK